MFTGGCVVVKVFDKLLIICSAVELVTVDRALTYGKWSHTQDRAGQKLMYSICSARGL